MSSSSTPGTDGARRAWRAYFETTQRLTDRLERTLKEQTALSLADYNMLLLLWESPRGSLRMGELAAQMVFSPSRVTYQVKCLVARGFVERRAAEGDRRGFEAVLTDAGRTAIRKAAVVHTREVDSLFMDALEPGDADVLARIFTRIGAGLDPRS